MRYQVPQFIEVEDKIFGPLTLKQFIYLVGGAGMAFIAWRLLPLPVAVIIIVLVLGLSASLAFVRINNRPFILLIESALRYVTSKRLYLWDPDRDVSTEKKKTAKQPDQIAVPHLSDSKLRDLAWSLDVHTSLEGPEKREN